MILPAGTEGIAFSDYEYKSREIEIGGDEFKGITELINIEYNQLFSAGKIPS